MGQRATSALVLVPPLLVVLLLGLPWIAIALAALAAVGAWETFRILDRAGLPALPILGSALAAAVALAAASPAGVADRATLALAIGVVLAAVGSFARPDPRDGMRAWIATVFGASYVGLLGSVARLGIVAPAVPAGAPLAIVGAERGWILLLVLTVWSYDTGAYLVGRRFGRSHFLVDISPSKTYEGLAGGLVGATIVATTLLDALGQSPLGGLVLGPLMGLAAQAGDLAESMLKRAGGVKDSGALIPGHGGVLDRIDSFLFAAPVLTLYVVAILR